MKKIFTLLLFAVALMLHPVLQAQSLTQPSDIPLLKTFLERARKLSVSEGSRLAADQTIRVPQTEIYATWGDNNQWLDSLRTTYTYNNRGLWETATTVELPSNTNQEQYTFIYNSQGIPTEIIIKEWASTSNTWVNSGKITFEFNGDLLNNMYIYIWNNNAWVLILGQRSTHTQSDGRVTQTITEVYSAIPGSETNGWVQDDRIVYSYTGSDDRPTSIITSDRQGSAWVELEKQTEITYVGSTTDINSYTLEELDQSISTWIKYKYQYQYTEDAANKTRTTVETISTVEGSTVTPYLRNTTTELTSGERYLQDTIIRSLEEVYETATSSWSRNTETKGIVTRDSNGDITQIVYQEYSQLTNGFVNTERYTYSNFATITITSAADDALTQATEVYPNPVQNSLRITLDATKVRNASLSIYSITGQKVYEQHSLNPSTTLDISKLPAGIYMVKIADDRNAIVTRRIVKQ